MHISELDYDLPPALIAQSPAEPRDSSRLLVCDRRTQQHQHRHFRDLPAYLEPNDVLIANDTSVLSARLHGVKPTGGKVEVLLLRKLDDLSWQALVGGRNVKHLEFHGPSLQNRIVADVTGNANANKHDATFTVRFSEPIEPHLATLGETPLPPYIHARVADPGRYQTVYARVAGSAAAPTAGLHFTPRLLDEIREKGVQIAFVTLHVGLDTFKPIDEAVVESHTIHTEWCELPQVTADTINDCRARGGRVIAVGTTSARVLESGGAHRLAVLTPHLTPRGNETSDMTPDNQGEVPNAMPVRAARAKGLHPMQPVQALSGFTQLYITPGYHWRVVDGLITNFHLPRSTLLAMIGSFMGMDFLRQTYALAIKERYRFFSFGDAMLIV